MSKEAILKETKKVIIINAGHWDNDSGATYQEIVEMEEVKKIRDLAVPLLESRGYQVHAVPDNLDLKKSIEWANTKAPTLNDALALDIHLNFHSDTNVRGVESFHGTSETSKKVAQAFSDHVSNQIGIPNRGAKPDTQTYVGSLGWIRKTRMWASLVEVCFMSNKLDREALTLNDGHKKAAKGIAAAVDQIFGIETTAVPCEQTLADYTLKELLDEVVRRFNNFK